MNSTLRIILLILNIAVTSVLAVWTYTSNYSFEPLAGFIASIATLIKLFVTESKESIIPLKSIKKNVVENTKISNIKGNLNIGDNSKNLEINS